jgi:thymidine phosphorylase
LLVHQRSSTTQTAKIDSNNYPPIMNFLQLIEAKRDGAPLSNEQIGYIVHGVTTDTLPEYQIAAFLMAVYFKGLNDAETRALTLSMRDSGIVLQFPPDPSRLVVDKHSTGGVGDKVSLPLAPLLAALGFRVPMISGRGLGITGGTLDKLESIPGFSTALPVDKIVDVVERVGCAMIRQTETLRHARRDGDGALHPSHHCVYSV